MVDADLKARTGAYLKAHHVLTLATCAGAVPWAASLFYASDAQLNLYFISDPATRHCRELAANPQVAAAINPTEVDWDAVTGLQIEGSVQMLEGAARARASALYLARFPGLARLVAALADAAGREMAARFSASVFYRLTPRRIRMIDNRRGFGFREELCL